VGWKVVFAPRSESDLAKIVSYIADDDPAAAIRFGETLINKAESLADGAAAARKTDYPISTCRQLSDHLST
jgi:plasmid stabilization system protein ParE